VVASPRSAASSAEQSANKHRSAAAAVVTDAVALALEAVAAEAAEAVLVTAAAVDEAADRAAAAAERARGARAFAAEAAAQSLAHEAARTAAHVQRRAERAAAQVHQAAVLAAEELIQSFEDGRALGARRTAILMEATVRAAAHATDRDTLRAANAVASAGAAAAAHVAEAHAAAEQALDREVTARADEHEERARAVASEVALATAARAAGVAIAAREAAAALLDGEQPAGPEAVAAQQRGTRQVPPSAITAGLEGLEAELRESHEHLQFLVDAVTEYAIITLDPDGVITSWNTGAERLKGYTPLEAVGRHFSIFYTAEDRDTFLPQRLLELARAEGSVEHTGWRVRNDGSHFWGDVTISAVRDGAADLTGFVKVTRDLSEQHRLEIAQDSFYNAFVHDFRVPITAIKGFAELISDAPPEQRQHLIERIGANTDRLLLMAEELVAYASLRSGLIPISPRALDMTTLAQLAVANLASIVDTSRVRVSAAEPVTVLADPVALERVIANLVTNALKYSPAHSVIHLIVEQGEDVGVLRIVDQGRGIDDRDLDSIAAASRRTTRAAGWAWPACNGSSACSTGPSPSPARSGWAQPC
jgi:PAS domain S-box-containing protein